MEAIDNKEIPKLKERLKALGYAVRKRIRIYGEELELTSDPQAEQNGFVVEGTSRRSGKPRRLRVPLSVVEMIRSQGHLKKSA